jgi:uncharacterized Ntn-hydrolase superfamily protein
MKLLPLLLLIGLAAVAADVNTFSIVGYDPANGDLGVAVASRYFAVGSVVPWAEAGVGAIATQANVNVGYGPRGLELLRQGLPANDVLTKLLAEDRFPPTEGRQVAIVDCKGNIAVYTGPDAPQWAGGRQGKTWAAQGNILAGPQVPEAMGKAFDATPGELAEKLFAALKAGEDAGGDSRGKQSASILVVRKGGGRNLDNDRYVYINVDDNPAPIKELRRLLNINLGLLYSQKVGPLLISGKMREARDAASRGADYLPAGDPYYVLGEMDYGLGDKAAAIADFRKALKLDPAIRKRLQRSADEVPPGFGTVGRTLREILQDKEFLNRVLEQ